MEKLPFFLVDGIDSENLKSYYVLHLFNTRIRFNVRIFIIQNLILPHKFIYSNIQLIVDKKLNKFQHFLFKNRVHKHLDVKKDLAHSMRI